MIIAAKIYNLIADSTVFFAASLPLPAPLWLKLGFDAQQDWEPCDGSEYSCEQE